EDFCFGGRLLAERRDMGGTPGHVWTRRVVDELTNLSDVRVMPRTTVFGVYDGGTYGALERVADHLPAPLPYQPRQRLWKIVAKRAVLAAGAIERPIVFGVHDRPGIMLASARRSYIHRLAAHPSGAIRIFTTTAAG